MSPQSQLANVIV